MSMRLDGPKILRCILDHPGVFPLTSDIDTIARKFVVTRMKAAKSIADIKKIFSALGAENFEMVADGISDAEAKSIVGKVDKENREAKTAGAAAQRILLVELATGKVEPRSKIVKEKAARPTTARASSGAGKGLRATSMSARRKKES